MALLIRITAPMQSSAVDDAEGGTVTLEEVKMDELIRQIFHEENITQDSWQTSRDGKYFIIEVPVNNQNLAERVVDRLSYYNVGKTDDSSIMIIEPAAVVLKKTRYRSDEDISSTNFKKFISSLKSRLTVAQVYHAISKQGTFNFNYLCFLLCAALVADIALVTNSAACVFASMLLSPLMEPIMCIIFGLSLREPKMLGKGVRNTSSSLVICICVGAIFGIAAHFIAMFQLVTPYPTTEMSSRGNARSLIGSVVVAAASGVSISFAVLSNSLAAMIGNAISLSLLPPAINCGQLFLLALMAAVDKPFVTETVQSFDKNGTLLYSEEVCDFWWIKNYTYTYVNGSCDAPKEFSLLAVVSFALTLVNIFIIVVTGYSVNKVKDLVPQSFTNDETRRFYTKDVKEVRDTYNCVHRFGATELAANAYKEYIRVSMPAQLQKVSSAGIAEQAESGASGQSGKADDEADILQRKEGIDQFTIDLQAAMEEIGRDPHFQTISSWANRGSNAFLDEFQRAVGEYASKPRPCNRDGFNRHSFASTCNEDAAPRTHLRWRHSSLVYQPHQLRTSLMPEERPLSPPIAEEEREMPVEAAAAAESPPRPPKEQAHRIFQRRPQPHQWLSRNSLESEEEGGVASTLNQGQAEATARRLPVADLKGFNTETKQKPSYKRSSTSMVATTVGGKFEVVSAPLSSSSSLNAPPPPPAASGAAPSPPTAPKTFRGGVGNNGDPKPI